MSTISFEYNPRTFSDPSALPEGLHPAFLLQVVDEETPAGWQMAQKSPRMWRFFFAVFDNPGVILTVEPELQSQVCSQTFSAGGKYQASKAYLNMKACLNRDIERGEKMDPNSLVPLPCQLYISRYDKNNTPIDFANVKDVKPWPQGTALLTAELKARLLTWWQEKAQGLAQPPPPAAPAPTPGQAWMTQDPPTVCGPCAWRHARCYAESGMVAMLTITKRSAVTGTLNTMTIRISGAALIDFGNGAPLATVAPQLNAAERRFLETGVSPEEEPC